MVLYAKQTTNYEWYCDSDKYLIIYSYYYENYGSNTASLIRSLLWGPGAVITIKSDSYYLLSVVVSFQDILSPSTTYSNLLILTWVSSFELVHLSSINFPSFDMPDV